MNIPMNDLSRVKDLDDDFFEKLRTVIESGNFLNGPYTLEFERLLCNLVGSKYACGVSSGTAALILALRSLDLPSGSLVLTTANSGAYARIAADRTGLKVGYVDVTSSGLMDITRLKEIDLEQVRAIVVTHLYGQMADMKTISEFCKIRGIFLIEDCAQAIGASFEGRQAGAWGDVATFSFYPTKNLGAIGDAGAVVTNAKDLIEKVRILKQYGWSRKYYVSVPGGDNLRIDEVQALALVTKIGKTSQSNSRRLEIWRKYRDALLGGSFRILGRDTESFVAHLAVIDAGTQREQFSDFLNSKGIETAIHYPYPDYDQSGFGEGDLDLPVTRRLSKSILSIPLFPGLTNLEVDFICNALSNFSFEVKADAVSR